VSLAPRLAALLADHLGGHSELWPEADVARYYKLYLTDFPENKPRAHSLG
jgi:hypothetical protein